MRLKLSDKIKNNLVEYLRDEAIEAGIPLKEGDNLYALAYKALAKTPVGSAIRQGDSKGGFTFDELVSMVIGKLVTPRNRKSVNNLNEKYVKDYIIPNLVVNLKKDGFSLDEIKGHKNMKRLVEDFKVKDDLIDRVWKGVKKSLRPQKYHNKKFLDSLYDTKPIPEIFAKFMEEKTQGEADRLAFIKYWTTSVKRLSTDFWKSIKKVEDFDRAKYFGVTDNTELNDDEVSESEIDSGAPSVEEKLEKEDLYRQLSAINPQYEALLDNILDGKSQLEIKKSLGIEDASELKKLFQSFTNDLEKIVHSMGMSKEETLRVLRAKKMAKIANSILERVLDAGLL